MRHKDQAKREDDYSKALLSYEIWRDRVATNGRQWPTHMPSYIDKERAQLEGAARRLMVARQALS